jgi:hypothetical protein
VILLGTMTSEALLDFRRRYERCIKVRRH